ncbi:MAG: type II toxin-antitoxin system PemK/MazF family toxin [Candidatus Marinimicrobia bacterium]|nr:type II toxin-antitoxin system PemK/MazF family toxin [Candidatus Neomarinimicrobiota bacterium]
MIYKQWDIVLIPFPFTDLKVVKKRPVLIIYPNHFNQDEQDVIIVYMTSNLKSRDRVGDYKIIKWEAANLPKPTLMRMKLATISKSIILKKLGRLHQQDQIGFQETWNLFFQFN